MNLKKRLLTFVLVLIVVIPSLSSFSDVTASSSDIDASDLPESHLIEGVPYVSQETSFYCGFASFTMLIKYLGNNVTLKEVLHHSGIGYSVAYFRPRKLQPFQGIFVCMSTGVYYTGKFLASLYGLSFNYWMAKMTGNRWDEYWSKLKEKIKQDIPVATNIDPYTMNPSFYRGIHNISNNKNPHSGHAVVIVGFNESTGLVYYNEPFPTALGESEQNWTYVNVSIGRFKESVQNASGTEWYLEPTRYLLWSFEKSSDPLSKEEAFNKSSERNIQRLKGKYSEILYNIIPFTDYGVEAVKAMRRDLTIGLRHRFATLLLMKFFKIKNSTMPIGQFKGDLMASLSMRNIATEKRNVSQYLLENQYLSLVCAREGELLAQEADHWDNLSELDNELFKASYNGPLKTCFVSKPIIDKMKKELDEIISIEEAIIAGAGL